MRPKVERGMTPCLCHVQTFIRSTMKRTLVGICPCHSDSSKLPLQGWLSLNILIWLGELEFGAASARLRWHLLATRELHASSQRHLLAQPAGVWGKGRLPSLPAVWSMGCHRPPNRSTHLSHPHDPALYPVEHGTRWFQVLEDECGSRVPHCSVRKP